MSLFELTIDSWAPPGWGMGYALGQAVFVGKVTPGDRVEVEVIRQGKRHLEARLIRVIEAGANRVKPPCPHYLNCGGCNLLHLTYADQLTLKQELFTQVLTAQGVEYNPKIIAGPAQKHFRYKALIKAGSGRVGLNRHKSHEVVAIGQCIALSKGILSSLPLLAKLKDGEAEYSLLESKAKQLLAGGRKVRGENKTLPRFPHAVLEDYGFGELELQATSFAQANPWVTALIAQEVAKEAQGANWAVEHYAGSGTFTLALAQASRRITAFEGEKKAVKTLNRNLERLGLSSAKAIHAKAGKVKLPPQADLLLIDPPRAGLDAALREQTVSSAIEKIIYISCNPASLARDLARLTASGFRLRRLQGFDMYCHSHHLEALAVLSR